MTKDYPRTAAEFMAEYERTPEYRLRQRQIATHVEESRRRYAAEAAGLLSELDRAGFSVITLAELRKKGVGNKRVVPILASWLPRITYMPLKADLIATLGCRWARPDAAAPLVREFLRIDPAADPPPASLRWAIADALEKVADESVLPEILDIATDERHGSVRGLAVAALGNMIKARGRVIPVLEGLLHDDDVAPYAAMALSKLKSVDSKQAIEQLLEHPDAWVRQEARKALKKLSG